MTNEPEKKQHFAPAPSLTYGSAGGTAQPQKRRLLGCAIYTRKSTSEGLDQEFTSLDNQREYAESYIKSQQNEGWTASPELYDDGGFTGANIERPALQKLLAHIREGKVNCVVVYKVDRLSRSLLDFSQLLEFFDKHNVAFISITQHFNTNTSMGRLTLNILLSFAQFEREIISERTRDKMVAARKRGQWIGGVIPYGYQRHSTEQRKIVVNQEEGNIVKRIFDLYLNKVNSALEVAQILNADGIMTRAWTNKKGKASGKKKFYITQVLFILKNYTYVRKVNFKGQVYPGQQPAIIDEDTFAKVQAKLLEHRLDRKAYKNKDCSGLLSKVLKCSACGSMMVHTYTTKKGRHKYRYYLCSNAQKRGYAECPHRFVNAQTIEDAVIEAVKRKLAEQPEGPFKSERDAILSPIWDTLFFEEKRRIIRTLIQTVDCDVKNQKVDLILNGSSERLTVAVNMKTEHYKTRAKNLRNIANEAPIRKTLIHAHHIKKLIDENRIKSPREVCPWIHINETRLDQIMNTLLLSPLIQEEILSDNPALMRISERTIRDLTTLPDWNQQSQQWREIISKS